MILEIRSIDRMCPPIYRLYLYPYVGGPDQQASPLWAELSPNGTVLRVSLDPMVGQKPHTYSKCTVRGQQFIG